MSLANATRFMVLTLLFFAVVLGINASSTFFVVVPFLFLLFAFADPVSSFLRIYIAASFLFFSVGYYVYTKQSYHYSPYLLYFNIYIVLVQCVLYVVLRYFRLRDYSAGVSRGFFPSKFFLRFMCLFGLMILMVAWSNTQFVGNRAQSQLGTGVFNLFFQAIGILIIYSTTKVNFVEKVLALLIAVMLFSFFSLSRSSALAPLFAFVLINYIDYFPRYVLVLLASLISSIFIILAYLRSISDNLYDSVLHAITDPYASHFYYEEFRNGLNLLHGKYVLEYFYRLIPRSIWQDKPQVIGYGREVIVNENTRTPGALVEGFTNFSDIGAFLFPLSTMLIFYIMFLVFMRTKNLFISVFAMLCVMNVPTVGRVIVAKLPYTFIENLIITLMAMVVFFIYRSVSVLISKGDRL